MNIKETAWELGLIGNANVLNAQTREAAKASELLVLTLKNILDLSPTDSIETITRKVYDLTQGV